jgi:hypothetical protein
MRGGFRVPYRILRYGRIRGRKRIDDAPRRGCRTRTPPFHLMFLLTLYLLEAAGLMLGIGLYKYVGQLAELTIRQRILLIVPLAVFLAFVTYIFHVYRECNESDRRQLGLTVAMNLVTVTVLFSVGEIGVRRFSVRTPLGLLVAGTPLLPKSWEDVVARNRELLNSAPATSAYFIGDDLLGWTVGPNRRSKDGMYLSNADGLRSQEADRAAAGQPTHNRIAIVGDSFTFGLDVPFDESWGYQLERSLGSEFAVLNFGVDGYGVDQAYLRYHRDARPFHPALTIFGFIEHDLWRTMVVYSFISFPEWDRPFAKPRFVLNDGKLELLNVPLIRPSEILAQKSVADLPFIEYDPGYSPIEWQWRFYHASRLVRLLVSRFPRWSHVRAEVSEALTRINTELLLHFVRLASAEGTKPLIVYFPSRGDFEGQDRSMSERVLTVLRESGVDSVNLTSCVRETAPERAFIPGKRHYSAVGNAAVARCLLPVVREHLQKGR